jgi:hypothetical protein
VLAGALAFSVGLAAVPASTAHAYNDPVPVHATTVGLWGTVHRGGSNSCIDDTNFSLSWGNRMQIWGCVNNSNQHWRVLVGQSWSFALDGVVLLQNQTSGLCLDVWQRNGSNGTPIVQWPCNFNDRGEWIMTPWNLSDYSGTALGAFNIFWASVGGCVDDPNQYLGNGTKLQLYSCNQTLAQAWRPSNASPGWPGLVTPYMYAPWIGGCCRPAGS